VRTPTTSTTAGFLEIVRNFIDEGKNFTNKYPNKKL
jgi:hypothetical protein